VTVAAARPPARVPFGVRALASAALAVAAVMGAAGVTQSAVFSQPGGLKYALTIAGPLIGLFVVSGVEPLVVSTCLLVAAGPFAGFTTTLAGFPVPLLLPVLALAVVATIVQTPIDHSTSAVGRMAVPIVALLVMPIAESTDRFRYGTLVAVMVLTAWVVARATTTRTGRQAIGATIVASAALQGGLAFWEFRTGHRLDLYGGAGEATFGRDYFFNFDDINRATGSFYDPISLGNALALAVPLAVALAVGARSAHLRWALVATGAIGAVGLALTYSRMSWLGAIVGAAVAIALLPRGRRLAPAVACAVVAVVGGTILIGIGGDSLDARFSSIADPTSAQSSSSEGDRVRTRLWGATTEVIADNPVAGVGFGNLREELSKRVVEAGSSGHAHSTYLQLVAEGGLFGLAVLVLLFGALVGSIRLARARDPVLGAGLAGCVAALAITWTTDFTVRYTPVASAVAVIVGLVAGLGRKQAT